MNQFSENGLRLLKEWEGSRSAMYRDSAGLPTIGVGHLLTRSELTSGKILIKGQPTKYSLGLSDRAILDLLAQDVHPVELCVKIFMGVSLNQNQFDALVSFVFNVGKGAFQGSTLLKLLNQGNYAAVPEQLRRWTRAGGQVIHGLEVRRENEIKLWNQPVDQALSVGDVSPSAVEQDARRGTA